MPTKYTRELLEPIVKRSRSIAQVITALGLRHAGGNYAHLKQRLKTLQIDTSHFLGQHFMRGRAAWTRLSWQSILVKQKTRRRQQAYLLRRALIEFGRMYKCEKCGNIGEWQGEQLTLEVDHKNGDWLDNRPENIRFLCPNCHSQVRPRTSRD